MPWLHSTDLDPPLSEIEHLTIIAGQQVCKDFVIDGKSGVLIVNPEEVHCRMGVLRGVAGGIRGPNGEDGFFHVGAGPVYHGVDRGGEVGARE